jgi:hypothetical protein
MTVAHTRASRAAAAATGLLTVVHLVRSFTLTSASYVEALTVVAAVLSCLAALKLYRDNCFESRLAAVLLALVSGLGTVLAATLGLPGQHASAVSGDDILLVMLGVTVPLLVLLDRRLRRGRAGRSSYAS